MISPIENNNMVVRAMDFSIIKHNENEQPHNQHVVIQEDIDRQDYEVVGAANMLEYPEYSDVSKARSFLSELERGEIFKEVLSDGSGVELTVRIGTENDNPELKDCSVITISYSAGGEQMGSMAVIGPTRMDYEKVVAVLKCMSESLSSVLSGMLLNPSDDGEKGE